MSAQNAPQSGECRIKVSPKPMFSSYLDSKLKLAVEGRNSDLTIGGKRIFTIYATAFSSSERIVPLRRDAAIIIVKDGVPLKQIEAHIEGGGPSNPIMIKPNQPTDLYINEVLTGELELKASSIRDPSLGAYAEVRH